MSRNVRFPAVALLALLALASSPASAQAAPTASQLLDRSVEAMGGFESFARLREVRIERVRSSHSVGSEETERIALDARFPHTMTIRRSGGATPTVHRYRGGRVTTGPSEGALETASTEVGARVRDLYWSEWWMIYARYAWHGLGEVWLEALEPQTIDGRTYDVIRVRPRDVGEYRLLIDRNSQRPARRVLELAGTETIELFSDFEEHDGILFPRTVEILVGGEPAAVMTTPSISLVFDDEPLTLERHLDAIVTANVQEKRIPGLVAIVQRGDEVLFEKAYGHESVALDLPARLDSVFPLASVSKTVAGVVAMRLVELGLLDLDASISDYLEGVPKDYRAVTPRHLLNHSHGLADVLGDNPGQGLPMSDDEKGTARTRFQSTFSQPLAFEPGQGWAYSLIGYEILQAVLEAASGIDYETLAAKEVLAPLGMASARFGGSDRVITGRPAMDYIWLGDTLSYNYLNYPRETFTAAGLNASARDVMTFYRALATGKLLEPATRDEMWREVHLADGEPTYYGLGWGSFRTSRDNRWSVGHSGGGSSWTRYFPDADLTVVVLSNLNGARADKLVYDLATAVSRYR